MGTRHHCKVINNLGEVKISQYGQWDGYPSGQGVDILKFLKQADLKKYQEELEKIREITESEIKEVNADPNWSKSYPYLSRDCGSDIHQMIQNGVVKFVQFYPDERAKEFCEGFYTIDFQKGVFITEYYDKKASFKLSKLPKVTTYLKRFESSDED